MQLCFARPPTHHTPKNLPTPKTHTRTHCSRARILCTTSALLLEPLPQHHHPPAAPQMQQGSLAQGHHSFLPPIVFLLPPVHHKTYLIMFHVGHMARPTLIRTPHLSLHPTSTVRWLGDACCARSLGMTTVAGFDAGGVGG